MLNKCILALAVILTLLNINSAIAQSNTAGTITGKVYDGATGETLPSATLVLLNQQTKAQVKIAQADINGAFTITNIPFGTYTFRVTFVGYQTAVRQNVTLSQASPQLNIPRINLTQSKGNALKEVTVTAQKPAMRLGVDRKVFSVEQSLVSEGGTATDLLNNIPSVETDMDGNVSLRGADNVRVLIDGRPSNIAGGNVAQILQSIPANSIESVELITNPSSKYDAAGSVGILNIVLKKNVRVGTNGGFSLSAGNRNTYNGTADLSYRTSKFNVFGNYGFRTGDRKSDGYSNLTYNNPINGVTYANQNSDETDKNLSHNLKAGIDWYATDKTTLSLSGSYNYRNGKDNETINVYQLDANKNMLQSALRNNYGKDHGNNGSFALDGLHKFARKGEELSFNASFSHDVNSSDRSRATSILINNLAGIADGDSTLQVLTNGYGNNYNAQLDYVLPINDNSKFEAGYRTQIVYNNNNQQTNTIDEEANTSIINGYLTNHFVNNDRVHALYANYQNKLGNFGYQLGLRYEDAYLKTDFTPYDVTNTSLPTHGEVKYKRLYPSIFLSYSLPAEKQVSLSYTRRVDRPKPWDINPFRDISQPFSQRQGNPNLKPEDIHSFELAYMQYFKKVTFTSSLYYRRTNDSRQRLTSEPDANGITVSMPVNAGSENDLGLELISKIDWFKAWSMTANANLRERILEMPADIPIRQKSAFTWSANLTNNFTITPQFSLQLRADYRSKRIQTQGIMKPMWGVDGGAKYTFADKKSSLALNARDIFATRRFGMTSYTNTSMLDFSHRFSGTQVNLTYAYRFGNTNSSERRKAPEQQQRSSSDDDETGF